MADPKSQPPGPRTGPPYNPGLRKLIAAKRQWHRPERTLRPAEGGGSKSDLLPDKSGVPQNAALPPEGGVPKAGALPPDGGVPQPGALPPAGGVSGADGTPDLSGSRPAPTPTRTSSSGTPAPAGSTFLGWHERGYLPHFDAPNVTQFVTFMLHDAFPVTRRREWEGFLNEPDESLRRRQLEAWLDRGHGECWLRAADVASLVEEKLRANDSQTYRLQAWAVMPNHVHLVVDVWELPLSKLLQLWKGGSARAANLWLKRRGPFWEREYFDTLIRDAAHLGRAIRYTEANPVKAGLVAERKAWRWGSARLRDEYERLPWQRAGAAA